MSFEKKLAMRQKVEAEKLPSVSFIVNYANINMVVLNESKFLNLHYIYFNAGSVAEARD